MTGVAQTRGKQYPGQALIHAYIPIFKYRVGWGCYGRQKCRCRIRGDQSHSGGGSRSNGQGLQAPDDMCEHAREQLRFTAEFACHHENDDKARLVSEALTDLEGADGRDPTALIECGGDARTDRRGRPQLHGSLCRPRHIYMNWL